MAEILLLTLSWFACARFSVGADGPTSSLCGVSRRPCAQLLRIPSICFPLGNRRSLRESVLRGIVGSCSSASPVATPHHIAFFYLSSLLIQDWGVGMSGVQFWAFIYSLCKGVSRDLGSAPITSSPSIIFSIARSSVPCSWWALSCLFSSFGWLVFRSWIFLGRVAAY